MIAPARVLQPDYFDAFRCIGAACEDTCCAGWTVHIDKTTYGKYQNCSDPQLAPALRTLVTINGKSSGEDDYAQIMLSGDGCHFLNEGLCSIQQRLGEEYLSDMCATYPRVVNRVDQVWQRSLDLSCPEAARAALRDARPMEFHERDDSTGAMRPGNYPALDLAGLKERAEPYRFFREVRRQVVARLQDRSYPIWKRLLLVGRLCESLNGDGPDADAHADDFPAHAVSQPAAQLEAVLDLIVARISADANPRRFLECYQEFMQGLAWTPTSTMEEIGARYAQAFSQHYAPFLTRHEYMLEHVLVNYAHRTLFPFGLPGSNRRIAQQRIPIITAQYMLMIAHYAIIRTLLIGMAGFHREAFGTAHVIKLIQSCAKTFEHSLTYPGRAVEMLAEKGMNTPLSLCVLIAN